MTPTMLSAIWIFLSISIALGQLLSAGQTDWIVHGNLSQGLFANCYLHECQLRSSLWPLFILTVYLFGISLLFFSSLIAVPYLIFTNNAKPIEISANAQLLGVFLMGLTVVSVPIMNIEEIHCTANQLLQSHYCRIGWAYALACVLSLISMCCPLMARLIADHRKTYSFIAIQDCTL
uniref:Transmembrane protein 211 n=1 Tax=Strongyloides venezuelensis TaxID=75913 RepID=A0A0K0G1X9_STRVS